MSRSFRAIRTIAVPLLAAVNATCADRATAPPAPASVAVTSDIGDRLAVGYQANLTAIVRDASGNEITGAAAALTWTSSANSVATVSASGVVSGLTAGPVTITAASGDASGSFSILVRAADFAGITAATGDALMTALTAALTTGVRSRVQAALNLCASGVTTSNFTSIESCIFSLRAEASGATDTDRALLATIALFVDHIERRLEQ